MRSIRGIIGPSINRKARINHTKFGISEAAGAAVADETTENLYDWFLIISRLAGHRG